MTEKINLFAYLSSEQEKLVTTKTLKKGEYLYREGEIPRGLFFLSEGLFALTILSETGVESLLRVFSQENFCGHRSFIAEENYHASALALRTSKVFFLEKELAKEVLLANQTLQQSLCRSLARDLKMAESRFHDMVGKRAHRRVIESLVFLKHQNEDFPWTRREIGEFCGVKTETVSRILSELEEAKLIEKVGRSIKIIDEDKLLHS